MKQEIPISWRYLLPVSIVTLVAASGSATNEAKGVPTRPMFRAYCVSILTLTLLLMSLGYAKSSSHGHAQDLTIAAAIIPNHAAATTQVEQGQATRAVSITALELPTAMAITSSPIGSESKHNETGLSAYFWARQMEEGPVGAAFWSFADDVRLPKIKGKLCDR
jgi:hypothetical protein